MSSNHKITTNSNQGTKDFGKKLASSLRGGDIICLYGELGAGKTTLVKGIAEGLGVTNEITSPTFTLMNVYYVRTTKDTKIRKVIHIDTYRLTNAEELIAIGVEDYLGQPDTVTIVEWPEKIEKLLEGKRVIKIALEHGESGERKIRVEMKNDE